MVIEETTETVRIIKHPMLDRRTLHLARTCVWLQLEKTPEMSEERRDLQTALHLLDAQSAIQSVLAPDENPSHYD